MLRRALGLCSCISSKQGSKVMATDGDAPTHTTYTLAGYDIQVSLPASYEKVGSYQSSKFNVLYVLGEKPLFAEVATSTRANFAALKGVSGRNWFPELIVVCVRPSQFDRGDGGDASALLLNYLQDTVIPTLDTNFRTNPYAAARAVCGGAAAARLLYADARGPKACRYFVLSDAVDGSLDDPSGADDAAADQPGATFPEKTQAYVGISSADTEAAARAFVDKRVVPRFDGGGGTTSTVMTVDRYGAQHYSEETTQQAPPLTMDILGGDKEPFAQRSTRWLGERFERQKLEQLGSLLPWHEFK